MSLYRINRPKQAQANFHVKKNDEVVVLSGTQQGKRGKVLQVLRDRGGGIIEREGTLHISKVMLATAYDSRKSSTAAAPTATESEPAAAKPAKKTTKKK